MQLELRRESLVSLDHSDAEFFSGKEVCEAVGVFGNGEAPGRDLMEVEVFKVAVRNILPRFVFMYNAYLQFDVFPRCWKDGLVELIPKGGREGPH